jgi:transposase, IS30 family
MRVGDTESDFIVSVKGDKTALATNIDRKSRYLQAKLIPERTCDEANRVLEDMMNIYNTEKTRIHSVTLDNDVAFQHHREIRDKLKIATYFCHPYSSWEKGQIEYGNRLIRRQIPKKSRLANYSQNEIDRFLEKSNNTPRKCLGWKTPIQVLREEGVAIGGTI